MQLHNLTPRSMPKPLVSLSKPKWTQNVEKSSQGEKRGYFFSGGRAARCVAHSDTAPCHPLQRRPPPRSEQDTKKLIPAPFIPCQLVWLQNSSAPPASAPARWARTQTTHRTLLETLLRSETAAAPCHPAQSQGNPLDVSACSITTRNWQPTRIYSLSLSL